MNESPRPDDQIVDDAVRRAYRSGADDKAPEHLDRRVLAEAGYAVALKRGRRWPAFRPLAWAATIGLSLVLVMQVTTLGPEPPPDTPPGEERDGDADQTPPALEAFTDRSDETAPAAISPAEKRERLNTSTTMSAPAPDSRRAGNGREAAATVAEQESGLIEITVTGNAPQFCDDEQRRDAESWRQCIVALLESDYRDRADIEYEVYRAAFPEAPTIDLQDSMR